MKIDARYHKDIVWVKVAPAQIDLFNKIIEAYDNLALVSTVDAETGLLAVWTTPDTRQDVLKLIHKMPIASKVVEDVAEDIDNPPSML